jgi:hypothetical protein
MFPHIILLKVLHVSTFVSNLLVVPISHYFHILVIGLSYIRGQYTKEVCVAMPFIAVEDYMLILCFMYMFFIM